MVYVPHTDTDRSQMLQTAGVQEIEDLFSPVPSALCRTLDLPKGISEFEIERGLETLAAKNRTLNQYRSFLGGGIYNHWIPPEVTSLASRREFMTAYTPYQGEASQGTLKAIFEFQSMISTLTGLEVANASVYDGASAVVEGCLMAIRQTRRNTLAVSPNLNPRHQLVLRAVLEPQGYQIQLLDSVNGLTQAPDTLGGDVAAVVIQNPNGFGGIESLAALADAAHGAGALLVASVNPSALGLLAAPGECGADVAVGEGQPLGLPPSYGGACFGFMASTQKLVRRLPGRIAGSARDSEGREGYALTLQTREQHIRREKATSNICTNQALYALHATIYLSCLGPQGLREVAVLCLERTRLLKERLLRVKGVEGVFDAPHFHEWVFRTPLPAAKVLNGLRERGVLGGIGVENWMQGIEPNRPELENAILTCATELTAAEDIEAYGAALEEVLR